MRKIKDVLRLSAQGLSARQIAQSVGISRGAVGAYKSRANAAGLTWPLPLDLTDTALEGLLFPCSVQVLSATFPQPDYRTARHLDKSLFQQLLTGKWIKDRRNLIITGPCGVGKTWLACALNHCSAQTLNGWPHAPESVARCYRNGRPHVPEYAGITSRNRVVAFARVISLVCRDDANLFI